MSGPPRNACGTILRNFLIASAVLVVISFAVVWWLIFYATPVRAACQMMGELMVCDNGQTFQRMGDKIVDDWGHTWVIDDDYIHTDQAYPAPLVGELLEETDEEQD